MIEKIKNIKVPYNLILILLICGGILFITNSNKPTTSSPIPTCKCVCDTIKKDSIKQTIQPINIYIKNEIKYSKK